MANPEKQDKYELLRELRPHALWDGIKAIGGGLIGSFAGGLLDYLRHRSVDWWGLLILGVVTTVFIWVILRPKGTKTEDKPHEVPSQPASRLKIISAYYGVEGGPDEDVADKYLRPRVFGDSLVGWVGADLFGGFQPVIGLLKRLKIRYSFNGEEAAVVRREHEMLVLPEDKFLKGQLEECQRQSKLNENQSNSDLWRARESSRQCEDERRKALDEVGELRTQLAVFSPLQLEIIKLSRDLRQLLKDAGLAPEFKNTAPVNRGEDSRTWTIEKLVETHLWSDEYATWARKLIYSYEAQFAGRVQNIMTSIGRDTGSVVFPLKPYTETVRPGDDFQNLLDILMDLFVQVENPKKKPLPSFEALIPDEPSVTLLSSLQVEAFQLAKDLRSFFCGLGPRPAFNEALQDGTREGIERALNDLNARERPWDDKLLHGYSLRFAQRVARLRHLFGEQGLRSEVFENIEHLGITNITTIPSLAREIERLAVELNYTNFSLPSKM